MATVFSSRDGERETSALAKDLFHRHFAEILRFFDNKAWDKAEDLTQQTFLECVGSRDRFRGDSSFRTYLFAIAWNQLRHHYRQGLKNEHVDFDASSGERADRIDDLAQQPDRPCAARGPDSPGTQCLPMAQQALLECHYWQDLDAAALSEIFGVPPGAIRVRLLRARNALRAELAKLDGTRSLQGEDAKDPLAASLSRLQAEDHREEYP